jgi:hypothetical protein
VVINGSGLSHANIVRYTMEKSILTLHAGSLALLLARISIDPSIVVTTTADFMTGTTKG